MLNFLEGRGLTMDVCQWFEQRTPKPRVSSTWVMQLLKKRQVIDDPAIERRLVWLGGTPACEKAGKRTSLFLPSRTCNQTISLSTGEAQWLLELLSQSTPQGKNAGAYPLLRQIQGEFPDKNKALSTWFRSPAWKKVRRAGLLLV